MNTCTPHFLVPTAQFGVACNLKDRAILFHAVNKSGSFALASALRDAYEHAGRQNEFISHFGVPKARSEAIRRFSELVNRPCILIDHDLVGLSATYPGAAFATTLRDPVRRLISCYFWLRTHHPDAIGDRHIIRWTRESGRAFTLCFQFACDEAIGKQVKLQVKQLDPLEMAVKGETWFDNNVVTFGVTEFFEETLMVFACELGLPKVTVWRPDKRNRNRPKWNLITGDMISEIADVIHYDVDFYQRKKGEFLERYDFLIKSDVMSSYKSACENARIEQENYGAD